jgi:hypothetical protein
VGFELDHGLAAHWAWEFLLCFLPVMNQIHSVFSGFVDEDTSGHGKAVNHGRQFLLLRVNIQRIFMSLWTWRPDGNAPKKMVPVRVNHSQRGLHVLEGGSERTPTSLYSCPWSTFTTYYRIDDECMALLRSPQLTDIVNQRSEPRMSRRRCIYTVRQLQH